MKKLILIGLFLSLVPVAQAAPRFKSEQIDLPTDSAVFPDGPNVKVATQNCVACHSVEMVLDQPLLPRAAWAAEVAKMRNTYKAPISEADTAMIVDYLAATHSPSL
jgi:mono/diheme cytochrome c family protein